MAFSYSGDPSDSDLDAVRFLIGDTDSTAYFLHNAEIEWLLTEDTNIYWAAVAACRSIAASLAQQPEEIRTGVVKLTNKERSKDFYALAERLRLKAIVSTSRPFAGGISIADKETRQEDTDRVKPAFTRETHVPPGETLGAARGADLTDA